MVEIARVSDKVLNLAGDRLNIAVDKAFAKCLEAIKLEAKSESPKFFPNGIELIYVCFDVADIVKVELKIAGPEPKTDDLKREGAGEA